MQLRPRALAWARSRVRRRMRIGEVLVVHPVSSLASCFEDLAGVGPLERFGGLVVGLDEREHLLGEVGLAGEDAVLEQSAVEDREEDLDLVEPRGVLGGELEAPPRMVFQPVADFLGAAGGEVVGDRDDLSGPRRSGSRRRGDRGSGSGPSGCGSWTASRARRLRGRSGRRTGTGCRCGCTRARAVPGLPGAGGWSGLVGALAWIPVFSSIETTSTFSGGSTYRPQISPRRSSNSGWEKSLMIQYSVRCGLISARERITCAWDADIPTSAPAARRSSAPAGALRCLGSDACTPSRSAAPCPPGNT